METAVDKEIRIICIICRKARVEGKQYTKRLLPEFLRPYCRVRLDLAFSFYQKYSCADEGYDLERGCDYLGCLDRRTVSRHLAAVCKAVEESNSELAAFIAHRPGFSNLVPVKPAMNELTILDELIKQVKAFSIQLGCSVLMEEHYFTALRLVHERLCAAGFSITYVCLPPPAYDTSFR